MYDASGSRHDGGFSGGPVWSSGRFGRAVDFAGNDDWISMGDCLDLGTDDITVLAIVRYAATSQPDTWGGSYIGVIVGKGFLDSIRGYGMLVDTSNRIGWRVRSETSAVCVTSDASLNDGQWHLAVGVCDRDSPTGVGLYIDGIKQSATADPTSLHGLDLSSTRAFAIGSRQDAGGTWFWDFAGRVAAVCVWKRVLAESEIRDVQRDPFVLFTCGRMPVYLAPRVGAVIDLGGSIEALSGSYGVLRRTRNVAGATGITAALQGNLSVSAPRSVRPNTLVTRMPWLGDALFHGATGTAFQLGTVLVQGWFWVRRNGCTAAYRGVDIEQAYSGNMVHLAESQAQQILLPAHLPHHPHSAHYYLVRRFNSCGRQEQTTAAAVMVRIGPDGELVQPSPNTVFGLKGEQIGDGRLRLFWFYCPVDQHAPPDRFNVYWDGASGQIDLEHPVATVPYEGRRFYSCRTDTLTAGRYRFVVRAESHDSIEGPSSKTLTCQITTTAPETLGILSIEAL